MAKRGRPPKPDAKRESIHFRLGKDESEMLNDLSKKTGKNKTDIFVGLITKEYKRIIGKEYENDRNNN